VEDHVRALFEGRGARVMCTRGTSPIDSGTADEWIAYLEEVLGPLLLAKAALEPEGRWTELRAGLVELFERFDHAEHGHYHADAEYLLTVIRLPG
jgi:hypothetical protein